MTWTLTIVCHGWWAAVLILVYVFGSAMHINLRHDCCWPMQPESEWKHSKRTQLSVLLDNTHQRLSINQ